MDSLQPDRQAKVVERNLKILFLLWLIFLGSIALYAIMLWLIERRGSAREEGRLTLNWLLCFMGLVSVASSVIVKRVLLALAVARRKIWQVVRAYIIAFALCEAAAIFGVVVFFLTRDRLAYLMFALAAMAIAAHYPRREHLESVPLS
ncbi:hypothetical protein [Pyrinomonas methylaliphatogenes]|jgi:F0F1-type ATP synthase membrane subunit c/vacuolar-type H+-ATPase subunit K|uniref:Uncharacterized protein n=1 Tax=Pyrinomonas methylaliphatogenes TaxID=454194 RepID=A0A0B6WVE2_9BACT|nr:hypothetical protein [Pyrinomonas methylaliphatogenes]CDM64254.1 hypothetical protein PYK22_00247 [Pyrinomonas methylaliphatogenes]